MVMMRMNGARGVLREDCPQGLKPLYLCRALRHGNPRLKPWATSRALERDQGKYRDSDSASQNDDSVCADEDPTHAQGTRMNGHPERQLAVDQDLVMGVAGALDDDTAELDDHVLRGERAGDAELEDARVGVREPVVFDEVLG